MVAKRVVSFVICQTGMHSCFPHTLDCLFKHGNDNCVYLFPYSAQAPKSHVYRDSLPFPRERSTTNLWTLVKYTCNCKN